MLIGFEGTHKHYTANKYAKMAGNRGTTSSMQVNDLIAQFINDGDVEERAQKEAILGELAGRVLNRYNLI